MESQVENQEQVYYQRKQDAKDKFKNKTDDKDVWSVSFDFKDKEGDSADEIKMEYILEDPNDALTTDEAEAVKDDQISLDYIAAAVEYDLSGGNKSIDDGSDDSDDSNQESMSVQSRLNTTIYGSTGMEYVNLYMVKEMVSASDTPEQKAAKESRNRYYFMMKLRPNGTLSKSYYAFAQIRISFREGGKVVGFGKSDVVGSSYTFPFNGGINLKSGYEVTSPSAHTIRIANTTYPDDGKNTLLDDSSSNKLSQVGFYVDLSSPIPDKYIKNEKGEVDMTALFGYSNDDKSSPTVSTDNSYYFYPYYGNQYDSDGKVKVDKNGNEEKGTYPNIFAAAPK